MIDKSSFDALKSQHNFIHHLPEKLQELISDGLEPESDIQYICPISVNGKSGCLVMLDNKMTAYWISKLLFMKFPTMQEFNYSQVNQMNALDGNKLYLHCSADPQKQQEDYEEGEFGFQTESERTVVAQIIKSGAVRLK